VAASSSIPGVIAPAVVEGRPLVDGAVTSGTPVLEAREAGARVVIVVDVSKAPSEGTAPKVGFEIMQRAGDIAAARCNRAQLDRADHILRPEVQCYHWARFDMAAKLIEAGADCARRHEKLLRSVFPHSPSQP
jgi:NTE family protein